MGVANSREYKELLEALRRNERGYAKLRLDYSELSEKDCLKLSNALAVNLKVKQLSVGACAISVQSLQHLARPLCSGHCRIKRLDLSTQSSPPVGNPLKDEGARILAQIIGSSPHLQHVKAASCEIEDVGGAAIADALIDNDHMITLDLSHNQISDGAAEQFGHALQHNNTLQGLLLWKNNIFHTGAEHIASGLEVNATLQWLGLGCNSIGDTGAKAIAISLMKNIQLSTLRWLGLGGNKITDQGARYLATMLEPRSPTAIPNLIAAIQVPHTPALFHSNKITASLVASAALGSSHSLAASSDSEFSFPTGSAPDITVGMGNLLYSSSVPGSHDHHSSVPGSHDHHSSVPGSHDHVPGSHNQLHPASAAAGVATGTATEEKVCCGIESLGLGGNDIGDIGATTLALALMHNQRLCSLGLADNRIGDEGAQSLSELVRHNDTLEKLILSNNHIRDIGAGQLVAALSQNSSLKGLYLAGNTFGDSFSVRCNEVIGRHNNTLTTLDIRNTRLSRPAAQSLVDSMSEVGVVNCLATDATYTDDTPVNYVFPQQPLKGKCLRSAQPALKTLTSLPAPEQTAQMLVIEVGKKEMSKRKGSMTDLFRRLSRSSSKQRLFSRKASSSKVASSSPTSQPLNMLSEEVDSSSYDVSPIATAAAAAGSSWSKIKKPMIGEAMELQTLVEEDETIEQLPLEQETQYSSSLDHTTQWGDHVTIDTPTLLDNQDKHVLMTHSDDDDEALNRNSLRNSLMSDSTGSNIVSTFNVPRQDSLSSFTKDRVRPTQRRMPLRNSSQRSDDSRTSIWSDMLSTGSEDNQEDLQSPREKLPPGMTRILATSKPIENSEDPALSSMTNKDGSSTRPLRDQWVLSLAQRIGVLRMGGFLHSCFQAIEDTPPSDTFDYTAATLMINQSKNRDGAPLPPGHSRVKLLLMFDLIGSDYINANYVGRPGNSHGYIASQAPTDSTVSDFWRMIWEHGVHVVVALSNNTAEECARYWPWELNEAEEYGLVLSGSWVNEGFTVTMTSENPCNINNCVVRTFHLSSTIEQEQRTVKQFHYTGWPISGVADSVAEVASLVLTAKRYHGSVTNAGPILVHGSLGVGRTGCFCAVAIAMDMMELAKESIIDAFDNDSNILDQVIRGLRNNRPGMVESCDQYEFCYRVLEESLWGEVAKSITISESNRKPAAEKKSKFKLFGRKRK